MSEIPIFILCERTALDLFQRTKAFPKSIRHSVTNRLEGTCLDILEEVVELRYSAKAERRGRLIRVDRLLLRCRVLIRLAHDLGALDHGGYEHVARNLDELGRMVGGWRKEEAGI